VTEDKAASGSEVQKLPWHSLLGIATAGMMLCGASYLWGFWDSFSINFLEYIGFQDIIPRTLFSIFPIAFFLIPPLAWVFLPLISNKFYSLTRHHIVLAIVIAFLFAGPAMILLVYLAFVRHDLWGALSCFCPACLTWLARQLLNRLNPDKTQQQVISWSVTGLFIGIVLFTSFWWGRYEAYGRKQGKGPLHYAVTIENTQDVKLRITDPVYVGRMGGFLFFASQTSADTVVIPESRLAALSIHKSEPGETSKPFTDEPKAEK
jgi:hypothetical protein